MVCFGFLIRLHLLWILTGVSWALDSAFKFVQSDQCATSVTHYDLERLSCAAACRRKNCPGISVTPSLNLYSCSVFEEEPNRPPADGELCYVKTCGQPMEEDLAFGVSDWNPENCYPIGSSLEVSCYDGYYTPTSKAKNHSLQCLNAGWVSTTEKCQLKCAEPFQLVGTMCLYLAATQTLSYSASKTFCQGIGADLASFHTVEEATILKEFVSDSLFTSFIWLGAKDEAVEGEWRWEMGSQLVPFNSVINWGGIEPNGGQNENCMAIYQTLNTGEGLVDIGCLAEIPPMCQIYE